MFIQRVFVESPRCGEHGPGTTRLLPPCSLQSISKQTHKIILKCDKCPTGKEDVLL